MDSETEVSAFAVLEEYVEAAAGVAAAVASVDKFDSGTGSCALSSCCCCCCLLGFCCVVATVDAADDDLLLCAVAVDFGVVTDFSVDCNVTRSDTAGGAGLSPSCPPPAELPSFMFETSEKGGKETL